MKENPLRKLQAFGQSIWLDFLRRNLYVSGELQRMIEEDGLRGMTSNPSIFEKAIAGSHDYDDTIRALALEGRSVEGMYDQPPPRISYRQRHPGEPVARQVDQHELAADGEEVDLLCAPGRLADACQSASADEPVQER